MIRSSAPIMIAIRSCAANVIGDHWADAPNVGPALDISLAVPCSGRQSSPAKPPDRRVRSWWRQSFLANDPAGLARAAHDPRRAPKAPIPEWQVDHPALCSETNNT
jgi:hypothetical protein